MGDPRIKLRFTPQTPPKPVVPSGASSPSSSSKTQVSPQDVAKLGLTGKFQNQIGSFQTGYELLTQAQQKALATLQLELTRIGINIGNAFVRLASTLKSDPKETAILTQTLARIVETLEKGHELIASQSRLTVESQQELKSHLEASIPQFEAQHVSELNHPATKSIARFLEILPNIVKENLLPEIRNFLGEVSEPKDFETFHNVVDQFVKLTPAKRAQVLTARQQAQKNGQNVSLKVAQALIEAAAGNNLEIPKLLGDSDSKAFHDQFLLGSPIHNLSAETAATAQSPQLQPPSDVFKFRPLVKIAEILNQSLGPQITAIFEKIFSGKTPLTILETETIGNLVALIHAHPSDIAGKIIPELFVAWIHRQESVRERIFQILKALESVDRKEFLNKNGLEALKIFARDRRSLELQAEAIQLALDLFGGEQGRSREEWLEFFKEIELVPTLRRLLRSSKNSDVQKGIELFEKTWSLLGIAGKEELVEYVLDLAQVHPSDKIAEKAIGLLFHHKGELSRQQIIGLLENYEGLVKASHEEYRKGGAHYVGVAAQKIVGSNPKHLLEENRYLN